MPEDDTKKIILAGDELQSEPKNNQVQAAAPATGLVAPEAHKPALDLTEIAAMVSGYKPLTPEQRATEEKRERREKLFSAIGDSVSALANLYFAGKTGYSNYNPEQSMSARAQQRWERIEKERQAKMDRFNDMYWKIRNNMDQQQRWQDQLGLERRRLEAQEEARKQSSAIAKAESDAKIRYYDEQAKTHQSQQKYNEARARYYDRSPGVGMSKGRSGGGGGGSGKYTLSIGGRKQSYASQADYSRAVEGYAHQYGIDPYESVERTDGLGRKSTTQKRKSTAQLAAEVEAAAKGTRINVWDGFDNDDSGFEDW